MIIYFDGELIHLKLDGKPQYQPYGTSHLDCLRQTWEILKRMEDSMMVYRMVRGPERKVFYVYTGRLPTSKAIEFVNKLKATIGRKPSDGSFNFTGTPYQNIEDVDKRFRFLAQDENFWIPVQEGAQGSTKIEKLEGLSNFDEIADIEYMRQKVYTGMRIPKAYLAMEQDVNRATLVQQDVHFARLINRYQEALSEGLEKLCILQLYAWYTGMRSDSKSLKEVKEFLNKYKISFRWTTASVVEEKAYLEGLKTKTEIADNLKSTFGDEAKEFIIKRIFQLSAEEEALLNPKSATLEASESESGEPFGFGGGVGGEENFIGPTEVPENAPETTEAPTELPTNESAKVKFLNKQMMVLKEREKKFPKIPNTGPITGLSDDIYRKRFIEFINTKFDSKDDIKVLSEAKASSDPENPVNININESLYALFENVSSSVNRIINSKEYKLEKGIIIKKSDDSNPDSLDEELTVPED